GGAAACPRAGPRGRRAGGGLAPARIPRRGRLPGLVPGLGAAGAGAVASRPMCEHFVARAAQPFALGELWEFAGRLERFGLAGWSWGAAWLRPHRGRASPPDPRPLPHQLPLARP